MRIGINLLFLKPGVAGGTETYSYNLLQGLANVSSPEDEFFIFCGKNVQLDFLKHDRRVNIIQYNIGKTVVQRLLFEQFIFPFRLKKYKTDVLHSLGYTGPVSVKKDHLVTIHDANAFVHTDMPWLKRKVLGLLMKLTAKACTHVIAVSHFAKNEIIKYLETSPEKITVIHEAGKFINKINAQALPSSLTYLENASYFVALSSASKNKNIVTLINAFKIIAGKHAQLKLVLIGYLPPDDSIQKQVEQYDLYDRIIFTGYVDDAILITLFQKSIAFVFPSVYEGFGLPLLEAQNLGVPVISSDKGSLPEIGQESVLYFDALNATDLSNKMVNIYLDDKLRITLVEKGFINAKRFSWNEAAKQVLQLYYNLNNFSKQPTGV